VSNELDPRVTDHLANERTFLAWFRTGLTLIALGIAAGQLLTLDTAPGVPIVRLLSTIVIATGAFLVSVGTFRYRTNRQRIDAATFRPAGMSVLFATAAALATAVLAIAFVWLIAGR
jgi:putative membrane protein